MWRDAVPPDETFTKTDYEWDTSALPEGKYRVRVEASDEQANPPGDVMTHAIDSAPFLVDNTPPVLQSLTMAGRILRARAVDGVGPIVRIEIAVDGKLEWRPLAAADGVFDGPDESVDADVSSIVPPGSHIVTVRAFDEAGNSASRGDRVALKGSLPRPNRSHRVRGPAGRSQDGRMLNTAQARHRRRHPPLESSSGDRRFCGPFLLE